ncbi:MAG: hypothetical protein LBI92_05620 [Azoarcus sp.]|jgi:hypothetical protein|nr:hypothetical protein [Azoarcus sp.]
MPISRFFFFPALLLSAALMPAHAQTSASALQSAAAKPAVAPAAAPAPKPATKPYLTVNNYPITQPIVDAFIAEHIEVAGRHAMARIIAGADAAEQLGPARTRHATITRLPCRAANYPFANRAFHAKIDRL